MASLVCCGSFPTHSDSYLGGARNQPFSFAFLFSFCTTPNLERRRIEGFLFLLT